MPYEFKGGSPRKMTIGVLVILAIILLLLLFYFAPFAETSPGEEQAPATPSTEWTTAPEEPGVEVDLPDSPITSVPAESGTEKKQAE